MALGASWTLIQPCQPLTLAPVLPIRCSKYPQLGIANRADASKNGTIVSEEVHHG